MFYRKYKPIHSNTLPGNLLRSMPSCRQGHFYFVKATAPLRFSAVLRKGSFFHPEQYIPCVPLASVAVSLKSFRFSTLYFSQTLLGSAHSLVAGFHSHFRFLMQHFNTPNSGTTFSKSGTLKQWGLLVHQEWESTPSSRFCLGICYSQSFSQDVSQSSNHVKKQLWAGKSTAAAGKMVLVIGWEGEGLTVMCHLTHFLGRWMLSWPLAFKDQAQTLSGWGKWARSLILVPKSSL